MCRGPQRIRPLHLPPRIVSQIRFQVALVLALAAGLVNGCGTDLFTPPNTPLFTTPITVNGRSAGDAIIDTGGGYDLMLKDRHGLSVIKTLDILIFDGITTAELTEPFNYTAGGFGTRAGTALVGVDLCNCNGVGYFFMRKTGTILGLDFARRSASFDSVIPANAVSIPFAPPPANMASFDTSFLDIVLSDKDGRTVTVTALIDTGAATTVMRRGLIGTPPSLLGGHVSVLITRGELGIVSASVGLFDTPGLPDLLIGLDVMRAWSNNWHFVYYPVGGMMYIVPRSVAAPPDATAGNELRTAKRLLHGAIP